MPYLVFFLVLHLTRRGRGSSLLYFYRLDVVWLFSVFLTKQFVIVAFPDHTAYLLSFLHELNISRNVPGLHCRWFKIVMPWLSTCMGDNPLANF